MRHNFIRDRSSFKMCSKCLKEGAMIDFTMPKRKKKVKAPAVEAPADGVAQTSTINSPIPVASAGVADQNTTSLLKLLNGLSMAENEKPIV